ncbi:MAG: helix-turn-helix domain-containing protein [Blastococcus sp.]
MLSAGVFDQAVERVVDEVAALPGPTRAALATRLGGRRVTVLAAVDRALELGRIHVEPTLVASRGGAPRAASGLFPGPAPSSTEHGASALSPADVEPVGRIQDGGQLRELRLALAVTQAALARQLRVSSGLVRHWEAGRQPLPSWVDAQLVVAMEVAQTATIPARRRKARGMRELVERVRKQPGVSRWSLVGRSVRTAQLLERAIALGQVHEGPSYASRQPVVGVFPGPVPRGERVEIKMSHLRQARQDAGWSQDALARRIGLARTTIEHWERDYDLVPSWAVDEAAEALAAARAARRDLDAEILTCIAATPGLSRKTLLSALGYTRSPIVQAHVDELARAGRIHEGHAGRHGQRIGLYPGPTPVPVLAAEQLATLRGRGGLSQQQLAEQVGTHVQAIRDWEGGRRPMSIEWQSRLLDHLDSLPDHIRAVRLAILEALPATRHQLELRQVAPRAEVDAALRQLLETQEAHVGRVATASSRGRRGFLPGPPPAGQTDPPLRANAGALARMLSPRELEVLTHLASGLSTSQVATALGISTKTVGNHVSSSLAKLELGSRSEALAAIVQATGQP